jgi:hypothetical protein
MKTIILVSAAMLGLTLGPAFAGESEGATEPNTAFTSTPGVVSMAPVQAVSREQIARDRAYAAAQPHGTWVFPPG